MWEAFDLIQIKFKMCISLLDYWTVTHKALYSIILQISLNRTQLSLWWNHWRKMYIESSWQEPKIRISGEKVNVKRNCLEVRNHSRCETLLFFNSFIRAPPSRNIFDGKYFMQKYISFNLVFYIDFECHMCIYVK